MNKAEELKKVQDEIHRIHKDYPPEQRKGAISKILAGLYEKEYIILHGDRRKGQRGEG